MTTQLDELQQVSAQIGADFRLIQAAGGNTSVKDGDTLWVKASGRWLMNAAREPLFVAVGLGGVRRRIAADEADPVGPEARPELSPPGLRPSIETTLHALMPHPVVLHVHSVDALAWVVREDGRARVAERLEGLRWAWVPYVRPGLPLTRAVAAELEAAGGAVDVVVFGNHGLVVGGDDAAAARARLDDVVGRLAVAARPAPPGRAALLAEAVQGTPFVVPDDPSWHRLGTDPDARRIAAGGALYPDHVVFLGAGLPVIDAGVGSSADTVRARLQALGDAPAAIVAGVGVVMHEALGPTGAAMLGCLAEVASRIDPIAAVCYLPDDEVAGLQQWDAEKYRREQAPR